MMYRYSTFRILLSFTCLAVLGLGVNEQALAQSGIVIVKDAGSEEVNTVFKKADDDVYYNEYSCEEEPHDDASEIQRNGNRWEIIDDGGTVLYYAEIDSELPPDDNWQTGSGTASAPTLTGSVYEVKTAPTASNVTITGTFKAGETITGDYDFSDPDGDTESGSTYQWYRADDDQGTNKSAISEATSETYKLTESDGSKYISFEVTPNDGTTAGDAKRSSWEGPVITSPEITLNGNDQTINDGATETSTADHTDFGDIQLTDDTQIRTFTIKNKGSGTLDLTGDPMVSINGTHASDFAVTEQPESNSITGGEQATFKVEFDPTALGKRSAQISIANNDDESPYTFAISGTGENTPPVFTSSDSQSYKEEQNDGLNLDANDGDGGNTDENITYSISGGADQNQFVISNADTGAIEFQDVPDFENPADENSDNTYEVEVTADDGESSNNTTTQTLSVTVTDVDEAPEFVSKNSQMIPENESDPFLDVNANDGDGGSNDAGITYSITGGDDQDQFDIDSSTGELSPVDAFNFEEPEDADTNNEYIIDVEASDGTQTSTQSITIIVTNVNEHEPVITFGDGNSSGNFTIAENDTEVSTITAEDDDANASLTYSISGGTDDELFNINETSGLLAFDSAPDAENATDSNNDNTYEVDVEVSDGDHTTSESLSITVDDVNEFAPEITSASSVSIDEQPTNDSNVLQVTASDDDRDASLTYSITQNPDADGDGDPAFAIDETTGQITVQDTDDLDREENTSVDLDVEVSDGDKTDNQTITVNLNDVNEFTPVVAADQNFSVPEDAANGDEIGTISASDEDATATLQNWTITSGNDDDIFEIDESTGELRIEDNTNLDFETTESYALSVTVGDGANTSDPQEVAIEITNVNDNAPVFSSDQTAEIDENSTDTVLDVNATNGDGGDTDMDITYSLSGEDSTPFSIDEETGALSLDQELDFENPEDANTDNDYELQVEADDGSFSTTQNITASITDTRPAIADQTLDSVDETANNGTEVGTLSSSDDDPIKFSITAGNTDGAFAIDNDGKVTVADESVINYETKNHYDLTVEANDKSNGAGITASVTIKISDINEPPVFVSPSSTDFPENSTDTVLDIDANDGEGNDPDENVSYQIADNKDGGLFEIDPDNGVLSFRSAPDFEQPTDRDSNGEYLVDIIADDGNSTETETHTITVTDVNDAPTITEIEDQTIWEDESSDTLAFTINDIDNAISALNIDAQSDNQELVPDDSISVDGNGADRTLTVTPAPDKNGSATITVTVSDGDKTTTTSFDLVVDPVNDAPTISGTPGTSIDEDSEYSFTPEASDPEDDELTFSISNKPEWTSFDKNTGTLSGTPSNDDVGTTSDIEISVSDGNGGQASLPAFDLRVENINDAPIVDAGIADQQATQNSEFKFKIPPDAFNDIDPNDTLSLSLDRLPDGLSFSSDDRTISGTPSSRNVGDNKIEVTATDQSGASVSTTFILTVMAERPGKITLVTPENEIDNTELKPNLRWQEMTSAQAYELQISTSRSFDDEDIVLQESQIEQATFSLENKLDRSIIYYWRVRGINFDTTGEWSDVFSFETIPELPTRITLLNPEDESQNSSLEPVLTWESISNIDSYEIRIATDADFSDVIRDESTQETTFHIENNLETSTTYYWQVRGKNVGGHGVWSDPFQFTTIPQVPSQISLITPQNESENIEPIPTLTWEESNAAASYEVRISLDKDFNDILVSDEIKDESFSPTESLAFSKKYYWQVRGKNAGGNGQWSQTYHFSVIPDIPEQVILGTPDNNAGGISRTPQFQWETATGSDSYSFELSTDHTFDENTITEKDLTETTLLLDEQLEDHQEYFWRVRAYNPGGAGKWSDTRNFITKAIAPTPAFPNNEEQEISIAPELSWESDYEDVSYRLTVGTDDNFQSTFIDTIVNNQRVKLKGLETNTTYYWRVRLETKSTKSSWTNSYHFTTRKPTKENQANEEIVFGDQNDDDGNSDNGDNKTFESFDYRLVGLPGSDTTPVDELFEGEYGKDWKVFEDNGSENDFLREHSKVNKLAFHSGTGYWVLSRKPVTIKGDIPSVKISENDTYPITLEPGWNIISNPFQSTANWSEIEAFNNISKSLFGYDGSFFESEELKPFSAYYLYNDTNSDLELEIPYTSLEKRTSEMENKAKKESITKRIQLDITDVDQHISTKVAFNYAANAKLQKQTRQYLPPLQLSKFGAAIIDQKKQDRKRILHTIGDNYDQQKNHYIVEVKSEHRSEIKWQATIAGMTNETAILIADPENGRTQILKNEQEYSFMSKSGIKKFDVYTGSVSQLKEVENSLVPNQITLESNYPNPFNPQTTIRFGLDQQDDVKLEVFDILGRKIRTLVDGQRKAGWHEVQFNGSRLASGTYFYRLIIGQQVKTRKMVLIK